MDSSPLALMQPDKLTAIFKSILCIHGSCSPVVCPQGTHKATRHPLCVDEQTVLGTACQCMYVCMH